MNALKKNLNEQLDITLHFWRTYDGQEIDLIEVNGDDIAAYEFKWGNKLQKIPTAFSKNYPHTKFQVVNQNNYLDFLLQPLQKGIGCADTRLLP